MRKLVPALMISAAILAATPAQADTVSDWIEFTNRIQNPATGPAKGSPRADVKHANTRVALAMFEAANAIDRRYETILNMPSGDSTASLEAAVVTAATRVLLDHFPAKKQLIEESYAIAMDRIAPGAAREVGVKIGEQAALLANAAGGIDPAIRLPPYRPFAKAGQWVPTDLPQVENGDLVYRPWALARYDALRPPPPPALSSETWTRDYNEVLAIGERGSKIRTPMQTLMARYRQAPDLAPALRQAANSPGRSLVQNARMFALLGMASDDAVLVMADAKIHYDFWRPITAIRNGEDDGNPATVAAPGWVPLLPTPNFAEYPCGHCVYAGMVAEVMKAETGNTPTGGVRVGSLVSPDLAVQVLPSWEAWMRDVSNSRIYAGVHFRFSNDVGEQMGLAAARGVMAKFARPLAIGKKK
jgi:hypothetical protein